MKKIINYLKKDIGTFSLNINKEQTTIMKAMAILFVLITHYPKFGFFTRNFNGLGAWGVSIFLFLSGYGLYASYESKGEKDFCKKRFKQVYIPFYILMFILTCVNIFILKKTFSFKFLVLSVIGIYPFNCLDPTMWYITYITIWYVMFYIIIKLFKNKKTLQMLFFLISIMLIEKMALHPAFGGGGAIFYSFFFPLGIYYYYFLKKEEIKVTRFNLVLIILFILSSILWWQQKIVHYNDFYNIFCIIIIAITIIISYIISKKSLSFISKIINCIGKNSFYLYLTEKSALDIIHLLPKGDYLSLNIMRFILFIVLLIVFSFILKKISSLVIFIFDKFIELISKIYKILLKNINNKKFIILVLSFLLIGCSNNIENNSNNVYDLMKENEYIIIDVRSKEEYEESHVKDSINIPYDKINENIKLDKDKIIFVYCQSGMRSNVAFVRLSNYGYEVYNLGNFEDIDLPKE